MVPFRLPIIRIMSPVSNESSAFLKSSIEAILKLVFPDFTSVIISPLNKTPKAGEEERTLSTLTPSVSSSGSRSSCKLPSSSPNGRDGFLGASGAVS